MNVSNAMTADFLRSAFGGECMAHMRYLVWGDLAEKEGFKNVARLFRAISYAERVHASNHFNVLGKQQGDATVAAGGVFGIGSTAENLQGAIDGELHEINQMYPVYLNTARFQNEPDAETMFYRAHEAEKLHADLFQKALDAVKSGNDMELDAIYVCPVCGHTILNVPPENCPVCKVKKEYYEKF